MDSNFALGEGGAAYAAASLRPELPNALVLTGCLLSHNLAASAGGVAVGNDSHATVQGSHFVSNLATAQSNDVLVRKGGLLDLSSSVFELGGAGIVSLGGEVQCDAVDCFPNVCTQCLVTPQPSTDSSTDSARRNSLYLKAAVGVVVCGCLVLCVMLVSIKLVRHDRCRAFGVTSPPGLTDSDLSSLLLAQAGMDQAASTTANLENAADAMAAVVQVEMTPVFPWPVMASSPAAIFVVDRTMRVVLWSSGKKASMLAFVPRLFSRLRFACSH